MEENKDDKVNEYYKYPPNVNRNIKRKSLMELYGEESYLELMEIAKEMDKRLEAQEKEESVSKNKDGNLDVNDTDK